MHTSIMIRKPAHVIHKLSEGTDIHHTPNIPQTQLTVMLLQGAHHCTDMQIAGRCNAPWQPAVPSTFAVMATTSYSAQGGAATDLVPALARHGTP